MRSSLLFGRTKVETSKFKTNLRKGSNKLGNNPKETSMKEGKQKNKRRYKLALLLEAENERYKQ
jgi:hypothetical protein